MSFQQYKGFVYRKKYCVSLLCYNINLVIGDNRYGGNGHILKIAEIKCLNYKPTIK